MDDINIIKMLFERSEIGLTEINKKYEKLVKSILSRILDNYSDVEECMSDVLFDVWKSIPPNRPDCLPAYISKIARRTAIDKLKYNIGKKRAASYTVLLSELGDCIPDTNYDIKCDNTSEVIETFLKGLDVETRVLFVRRYMYMETVKELADRYNLSTNNISVKLHRAKNKLKKILLKEGIKI